MPTDPLFYLIGVPAVFLISLGRGAFGGGLAILGVPLLAFAVDPVTATFMMAPIVSASDPFTVWAFPPRTWSMPDLKWLVPGGVVGLGLGAVFVSEVDPRIVALGISVVILWFTARYFLRDRSAPTGRTPVNPILALICGGLSGFTTFISHGGNPPLAYYLLPHGLPKTVFAGTRVLPRRQRGKARALSVAEHQQYPRATDGGRADAGGAARRVGRQTPA